MDDFTSRQAVFEWARSIPVHDLSDGRGLCRVIFAEDFLKALKSLPSAQPERKKGKWIIKAINTFELAYGSTGYEPVYECSECGGIEESYLRLDEPIMPEDADFPKYCPNCGAKMEKE